MELHFAPDLEDDKNNGIVSDFSLGELLLHNDDFLEEFKQFCSCEDSELYSFPNLYNFVKGHIYFIVIRQQQVEGLFNKLDLNTHPSVILSVKQSKLVYLQAKLIKKFVERVKRN